MNHNQKKVIAIGIISTLILLIYWYLTGTHIFTKTQVLVDKTTELDRLLGVENKEYVDQFVFGLLPSGISSVLEVVSVFSLTGLVVVITGILIYLLKNKKKEKQ